MNGWIKLHCQTIFNDIWRNDPMAWRVFEYLLLRAYVVKEGKRGTLVTTRYEIANAINGNHNTVYKALSRLKNAKMVTILATKTKTTITICNWHKYQGDGNTIGNHSVTSQQPVGNSLIKNKNKNNIDITKVISTDTDENLQVNDIIFKFQHVNPSYQQLFKRKNQRDAVLRLVERMGYISLVKLVDNLPSIVSDQFAPRVTTPMQLEEKLGQMAIYLRQRGKNNEIIKVGK